MAVGPFDSVTYDPEEIEDPNAELARQDVGFTGPDIETDQNVIAEQVFGEMATRVEGWQAHDGNPDTWLIESFSQVGAEIRALARSVPEAIFIWFGSEVLGVRIRLPAPATGVTRWIAQDDRGYEIRPSTQLVAARTGDDLVGFEVITGGTIPAGETTVEGIEVVALEDGENGNNLDGEMEVADPLDWVASVELTEPTRNGDDGQDRDEYLNSLAQLFRVMAFRPILPGDFALLTLTWIAGVGRCVAMDTFDARTGTWGHQRTVTLVVTGPDGLELPDAVKADIRSTLEAAREVNWVVPVIDADYETVNVDYQVTAFAEQDPALVHSICDDAIEQLLSPAQWRLGTTSPSMEAGEVIPPQQMGADPARQTIRVHDIVARLSRCRGVEWVGPIQINGQAADHVLGSAITLPKPGQINGTVNVPLQLA